MEEAQLIHKAMLGDAPALEALIDKYYNYIYAFCCRRVGNSALGADLCQDTFMKMVENLPRYKEQGTFKSWLFAIALNCCRDAMRKKRYFEELDEGIADGKAGFEEHTENSELLKKAMEELPDVQKEAIILRYYHGFMPREIANIQKIPLATVKTRLYRALNKLQHILGEELLLEK